MLVVLSSKSFLLVTLFYSHPVDTLFLRGCVSMKYHGKNYNSENIIPRRFFLLNGA